MEALTDLDAQLKRSLERYVGFLQQLLRILTERMYEHKAVRFFAQALGEAGCEVEVFESGGIGEPTPEGLPLNVVFARRKGAGGGNSLLLGAHLDTVPTGDPRKWTHGPWSAEIQEGRIYARGAHDDRSGAAILYMVVDLLNQLSLRTAGDLGLLVTTEEEFSTGGMKAYLKRPGRMHPDAYLMVDGNRANSSIVAHGGALSFQIGIPGPFGTAQLHSVVHDPNPIEWMSLVIRELRGFESRVREKLRARGADPRWPAPIVAITEIQSRGWISNVPEECVARGYGNVFPPLSLEECKQDFESFVKSLSGDCAWLQAHPPAIT